jgi:hypothetical protein
VVHEFSEDEQPRVGLEWGTLRFVVTVDGLDQADRRDLLQIGSIEPGAYESPRRPATEVLIVRYDEVAVFRAPVSSPAFYDGQCFIHWMFPIIE